MDVALILLSGLSTADLAAAREAAVLIFSDWATALQPGVNLLPGAELKRLLFPRFPATFPLRIAQPGLHALFTQHHPDEFSASLRRDAADAADAATALTPAWTHVFKPDHEHDDEVTSVGITIPGV
jgi:hypothetical protein